MKQLDGRSANRLKIESTGNENLQSTIKIPPALLHHALSNGLKWSMLFLLLLAAAAPAALLALSLLVMFLFRFLFMFARRRRLGRRRRRFVLAPTRRTRTIASPAR